jgi:hypothetical protein
MGVFLLPAAQPAQLGLEPVPVGGRAAVVDSRFIRPESLDRGRVDLDVVGARSGGQAGRAGEPYWATQSTV